MRNGIIEKIENTPKNDQLVHYLPHHCVLAENKTTKLRIVYDASAKTKNGCSLNECLYRGPILPEELVKLLIKFRSYKFGVIADVEKAFLQIELQEEDRNVTRFLWLKDINQPVQPSYLQQIDFVVYRLA